jgi:PhzF family phenazine biosynthesis protein
MKINVLRVNAFTDSLDGGNAAGVLLNSPDLNDKQMIQVTKELGVSETAFVFPSSKADYKVLFFSPTVEVELCGHGTIATFFTMGLKGIYKEDCVVTQETKAGKLPVDIKFTNGVIDRVMMTQAKPILKDIHLDISQIVDSLNISSEDIDDSLPKQIVSTGLFTLPICVKSFNVLKSIKPNGDKIEDICTKLGTGSYHVFTFETIEPESTYHARVFCPLYGVIEDPVTGTANGAVSSYLIKNGIVKKNNFTCEQGDILGRPGRISIEMDNDVIKVGGKAKIVEEIELDV